MKTFQFNVNDLCGDKDLQFTTSIWNPDEDGISHIEIEEGIFKCNDVIQIHGKYHFPFLDLQLQWNINDELRFKVCVKENQKLKYLNSNSTHAKMLCESHSFWTIQKIGQTDFD